MLRAMIPAVLAACVMSVSTTAVAGAKAGAVLHDPAGVEVGKATLHQTASGVLVKVRATGIAPGPHAFHVHQTGRCDGESGFESAGGHFALDRKHGFKAEGGAHPGDMPNVHVHADGVFEVELLNAHVSLEEGAPGYLFDEDGSALVIHAGADDYRSQPSGAAGDRIACGVLEAG